jgi:hypothetical protein
VSESLGSATLETDVDLRGLDRGLVKAQARIELAVRAMQRTLDGLEANVDVRTGALEAAAARFAASRVPSTGGPTGQSVSSQAIRNASNEVWGVRGPQRPGSLDNPVATVLMA